MATRSSLGTATALLVIVAACASAETADPAAIATPSTVAVAEAAGDATTSTEATPPIESTAPPPAPTSPSTAVPLTGVAPPEWLGTRPLPLRPGERIAIAAPTPEELVDRAFWTTDTLPPPPDDVFVSEIVAPAPSDVLARSTWSEQCPVGRDVLAWITVSFFGFDHRFHTGELLVHTDHAADVAAAFERLHELRFPIEEMRVTTMDDLTAPRTGDDNNTSSFVCRPAVNATSWSRHAFGAAIDLNPFHNPYVRGDVVIPELASAYIDRERFARGMVYPDVVDAFAAIGWGWGGSWTSASDWMHFSDSGT